MVVFVGSPRSSHISTAFFFRIILIEHLSVELSSESRTGATRASQTIITGAIGIIWLTFPLSTFRTDVLGYTLSEFKLVIREVGCLLPGIIKVIADA